MYSTRQSVLGPGGKVYRIRTRKSKRRRTVRTPDKAYLSRTELESREKISSSSFHGRLLPAFCLQGREKMGDRQGEVDREIPGSNPIRQVFLFFL